MEVELDDLQSSQLAVPIYKYHCMQVWRVFYNCARVLNQVGGKCLAVTAKTTDQRKYDIGIGSLYACPVLETEL